MQIERINDQLDRLQAGDKHALQEIFQAFYPKVCQTILRLVKDPATAEDLAQEVFFRFWQKREQIQINSSVEAYLRRMAVNEGLGYLRSKKYFSEDLDNQVHLSAGSTAEEQYLHTELSDNIHQAIDGLPPKCREVFQLSRFEEMSYQEIANEMGISIKTVENQMGKALKILRGHLSRYLHIFW